MGTFMYGEHTFFISYGRWVNVSESINALDVNGLPWSEDAKSIDKNRGIK